MTLIIYTLKFKISFQHITKHKIIEMFYIIFLTYQNLVGYFALIMPWMLSVAILVAYTGQCMSTQRACRAGWGLDVILRAKRGSSKSFKEKSGVVSFVFWKVL